MARLFTFGCSFTQYMWPTWADIVAYDMGIEYYNFAIAGLGNVGIHHRILEADLKHKFTQDDIILIFWTSWCREDRVKNGNWLTTGSVLTDGNEVYDRNFRKKYWDYSNDIVKNSTAIISTNRIFSNNIKWQACAVEFFGLEYELSTTTKEEKHLINLYKSSLPKIDFINSFVNDDEPLPFNHVIDCHPDVKKHLGFVNDYIYLKLDKILKPSTVNRFLSLQHTVETNCKKQYTPDQFNPIIENILMNSYRDVLDLMNFVPVVNVN